MPQIHEIMPGGEMDTSESLQVSSTSPEQPPPSRALHVRKNCKRSPEGSSRSSSHSSSRPPSGRSVVTHRGPGAVHLYDQRSITHHDDQRVLQVNQDQRSVTHQHEYHSQVNQDQRSSTHNQDQRVLQVTLGVSPEHVIEREATIISQALAAVNEARSQSASEITAMRNQVSEVHHQAQSHVHSVERRAHDLIQDLQSKRQSEMDQMQAVANYAHRIAQEQLNKAVNENASLMQTIHDQSVQLQFQKDEQRERRSVMHGRAS